MSSDPHIPPDANIVTGYAEALEVLRHQELHPTLHESQMPVVGGTVTTLFGSEHVRRRRIMNGLVRPDALDAYRVRITLPTLLTHLRRLRASPAAGDGRYRVELVRFSKEVFLRFAAALMGFDNLTEDGFTELEGLLQASERMLHVHFTTEDPSAHRREALAAGQKLQTRYVAPSIDLARRSGLAPENLTLAALLAAAKDPEWLDEGLSTREMVATLLGAIDTSTHLVVSSLDELGRWLNGRPDRQAQATDLGVLSNVIQEAIRLRPSLPHVLRKAATDVVLASGRRIGRGRTVAVDLPAVNLDESVFGERAAEFMPDRELPAGVPRYGISFGAGQHQCLGLRIALGDNGVGTHAHVLRTYLLAGVMPDPDRTPEIEPGARRVFRKYPAVFTNLGALDSISAPPS